MGNSQAGVESYGGNKTYAEERDHRKFEILRRVESFPVTLRDRINGAKEEDTEAFLSIVEENLTDLLYGTNGNGLDSNRDTHEEIETAIRFFPHVLCEIYWGTHPPIYAQLAYLKSVAFIPLLAKLGIQLNQFQEEERGGLFYREWDVLRSLLNKSCREWYDEDDEDQQCLIDEKYAAVMKTMREMSILRTEDIMNNDLMWELFESKYFPEYRLRFLVDWNPNCFYDHRHSIYKIWLHRKNIHVFRILYQLGALHFPKEFGFLFHIDRNGGATPFDRACYEYGTEKVTEIIGDVLVAKNDHDMELNRKIDSSISTLIYSATNSAVHLDGVYFMLRRDPGRYCHLVSKR